MKNNKMISFYFLTGLFSIVCCVISYISTSSMIISGIVFISFILFGFLILMPALKRFLEANKKRHLCYQFVNSFIISMSVCHSFDRAYELSKDQFNEELSLIDEEFKGNSKDKVFYLKNYFELDIYEMFLSILTLYLDQGGDILKISSELLAELTRIEDSAIIANGDSKRSLFEFFMLWGMSLIILAFLRFALRNFFTPESSPITFKLCVAMFFLLLLLSIFIYFNSYFGHEYFRFRKKGAVKNDELKK